MLSRKIKKGVLTTLILFGIIYLLFKLSLPLLAGGWKYNPRTLQLQGSTTSLRMINKAYQGIKNPIDYHVHVLGIDSTPQTYINPKFTKIWHPLYWVRYHVFMHAAGVTSYKKSWDEYTTRLLEIVNHMPSMRYHIFAFDMYHDRHGQADLGKTDFYISNQKVFELSQTNEHFEPVISVHPLQKDAVEELIKWSKKGVHMVKWLPNSMNIDPSDPKIIPFYKTLLEHNMALITHTGEELAVSSEHQKYGNPLLYRQALDLGVTVILAHGASYGECIDLDHPDLLDKVPCFDLFMRMMDESKYKSNLLADISSIYYFNRKPEIITTLLERTDLHSKLVNASDYPLPAVNMIAPLGRLEDAGFLTEGERQALEEIYLYNPLLFDFVLKRNLKHPESGQTFKPIVFEQRNVLKLTEAIP